MAGEMSQSEVTRENYPGLFALRDALKRRGIASEPRAFDQYQGPFLNVQGVGPVWYAQDSGYYVGHGPVSSWRNERDVDGHRLRRVDLFIIEHRTALGDADAGRFETKGAKRVEPATDQQFAAGAYTLRQAARRIAQVAR